MFLARRDMVFARGRFTLITAVVLLITLLIGLLSGLTGGLAQQNISAIQSLERDRIVLADETYDESQLTQDQVDAWKDAEAVAAVRTIGILRFQIDPADDGTTGSDAAGLSAAIMGGTEDSPQRDGQVRLSASAAEDLDVTAGDTVTVLGMDLTVDVLDEDRWYAHTPVAYVTGSDWQEMETRLGRDDSVATALAIDLTDSADQAELDELATQTSTTVNGTIDSLMAISSFRSEIGSLLLMVGMLFGISALVVGAFFTVWTMQRTGDVAVLKALGASTRSLLTDALGQSLTVLVIGVGGGILLTTGLGLSIAGVLPFVVSWYTTALPAALLIILGLAGAAFALRSVTKADALTALGSAR
ncbi:MAG TPA: ABC transporter permease [Candidatus Brevibacterium intestinigallinarum]|nr:ABC transporter permease [Candidatus Brevibacterium intestinigallinarum]